MDYIKSFGGRDYYFSCKTKKDRAGDCVARAISIACEMDWLEVMKDLFALGLTMGRMPNEYQVMERYLTDNGWVKKSPLRKSNGRKYKVNEFPIDVTNVIIITNKHVTALVKGVHYDSWNCGNWCANSYYVKENY